MIELDGLSLNIDKLYRIAHGEKVEISIHAVERVNNSYKIVQKLVEEGRIIYGITTGFGHLCNTRISKEDIKKLQVNLIRSHATGVGAPFSKEEVRAIIAVRINSLLKGYSGVRYEVIDALKNLLNYDVIPYVPQQGSVGSSGDLAPLSHIMLTLIGEGYVLADNGKKIPSKEVLDKRGLKPLELQAKEGLALINGTSVMTGVLGYGLYIAQKLASQADIISALTLEVLRGSTQPFEKQFLELRPYKGVLDTGHNVLLCIENSEIRDSHINCKKVQDAYSLRCIPQVHGASKEALCHIENQVNIELNSVTDNPIIINDEKVVSGGHFHGQPIALIADYFGIAMSELANISERRIDRLLNPLVSDLPAFLSKDPGVNSGYMIAQYTAASLVSENKVLAHPASVDSIPTSAYQEDHVSMGTIAARKAIKILQHLSNVLSIEYICSAQAYEYLKPLRLGKGTSLAYELIRKYVKPLQEDRAIADEIETISNLLWKGELYEYVRKYLPIR